MWPTATPLGRFGICGMTAVLSGILNVNGETSAPATIGEVFPFYYVGVDTDGTIHGQLHFAWQAQGGQIWGAWYSLDPLPTGQPGGRAGP